MVGTPLVLTHLHLHDFRSFAALSFSPAPTGVTVLTGPNGAGKTTLLEAVGFCATHRSFRGSARDAMIREGQDAATVRLELLAGEGRRLVEVGWEHRGRLRAQVNRQPVRGRAAAARAVPVSVFAPADLALVQGPPAGRRDLLDDALRLTEPRGAAALDEMDRALRQRSALLRQVSGRLDADAATTLDVWDDRLAQAGTVVAGERLRLTEVLRPLVARAYASIAAVPSSLVAPGADPCGVAYAPSWSGDLLDALRAARSDDLRRAATTVGPHRDDLVVTVAGREARDQASQGEQRCAALALRLAVHQLVRDALGTPPLLLLDDVFSELDRARTEALLEMLEDPGHQVLVTSATAVPSSLAVRAEVDVRDLLGQASGAGSAPGPGPGGSQ